MSDDAATGQTAAALRREAPTIPHGRPENLFGLGPVLAESGRAMASMPTGLWLRGPAGRLSAAGLGVLLDDVLGQSVLIKPPTGMWSVTTELNIDVIAPLPADGQTVSATSAPLLHDDAGGLARGEVRDAAGRCLAVATTWHRFAVGIPAEILDPPVLSGSIDRGESLSDLLRVRIPDTGLLDLPSRADLGNALGVVHGGVLFCLAIMVAEQVLRDSELEISSVRVVYLRPALRELRFVPAVVRRGRSLGLVRVDVRDAAGALCTSATVTARSAAGPQAPIRQG